MRMFLLSFDKGSKALFLFCFKKGFNIHLAFFFLHCEHIYPLLFHNHPWILTRLTLKFKQRKEMSQRKPAVGPAGLRMLSSLRPNYRVKSLHLSWHTSAQASGTPRVRGNPDFPSSPVSVSGLPCFSFGTSPNVPDTKPGKDRGTTHQHPAWKRRGILGQSAAVFTPTHSREPIWRQTHQKADVNAGYQISHLSQISRLKNHSDLGFAEGQK